MTIEKIETWMAMPSVWDDLCGDCVLLGFGLDLLPELTTKEKRSGYRLVTCRSGHENRIAVGWRAKKNAEEAEAQRAAEMAACPYVECTCGNHEERY